MESDIHDPSALSEPHEGTRRSHSPRVIKRAILAVLMLVAAAALLLGADKGRVVSLFAAILLLVVVFNEFNRRNQQPIDKT